MPTSAVAAFLALTPAESAAALRDARRTPAGHAIARPKIRLAALYRRIAAGARALFVVQANGQTAAGYAALKRDLEARGMCVVRVRNDLFRWALEAEAPGAPATAGLRTLLVGPTILVFSTAAPDAAAPTLLPDFARAIAAHGESTLFVGARLDGALLTVDTFRRAAALPPLGALRAELLALLSAPSASLAGLLQRLPQSLVTSLARHVADASASDAAAAAAAEGPKAGE